MTPQGAVNIIKEHVEQAAQAGYDYSCQVTKHGGGSFTLSVHDLDTGDVTSFAVTVAAIEGSEQ